MPMTWVLTSVRCWTNPSFNLIVILYHLLFIVYRITVLILRNTDTVYIIKSKLSISSIIVLYCNP
jgi:hypothetical protein